MTPAQKAAITRKRNAERKAEDAIWRIAHDLVLAINAMPEYGEDGEGEAADVAKAFAEAPGTPEQKAIAFRMMDERPGQFPYYTSGTWFGRLRRTRNHHYKALFAAIRGTP